MYIQPWTKNRQQNSPSRFRGRFSNGKRTVKSFNPYQLVRAGVAPVQNTPYVALHKFCDFPIVEELKHNIVRKGYFSPTPIQDETILHILAGRDVIGIANTGTGKTAAFLIPLIDKVAKNRHEKVLIISPTRELASQINDELLAFSKGLGIRSVLCIGGLNMYRQKNGLRGPYNFVIGTPGRIRDLVETGNIILNNFKTVVIDEADRLVDIGFIQEIKYFISLLPKIRQSLFFSATVDGKVREILENFVQNPITVSVKKQEITANIEQEIIKVVDRTKRIDQLHELLIKREYGKVLIFGRTKWGVQKLSDELVKRGFKAEAIHGNKRQNQRLKTLDKFKNGEINILLATDVASRGLDIPDVSHVINYDLPDSRNAYIHRIGRTGRANKKGSALTFVE